MNGFSLSQELEQRGVSRRDFLGFCASMATIMGLPGAASAIAAAVENEPRPILVWLEFQDCAGNTESFLRASHPTVADLILDTISLNYHETFMAAAGNQAESALEETMKDNTGQIHRPYRGLDPDRRRRRLLHDRRPERSRYRARGLRRRRGDHRGRHVRGLWRHPGGRAEPDRRSRRRRRGAGPQNLINMPACPANAENITALIVYYMTLKRWPPLDQYRRPLFAYGKTHP